MKYFENQNLTSHISHVKKVRLYYFVSHISHVRNVRLYYLVSHISHVTKVRLYYLVSHISHVTQSLQKSLKILKRYQRSESEAINRRKTDNTMANRKRTKGQ
jgi:hypothetical protein